MAYVAPDETDLIEAFPEFAGRETAAEFAIGLAKAQVDDSWLERDRRYATMLLAAHLLQAGANASAGKEIASESIGPFSVSYFKSDASWLGSTGYGAQYAQLARLNFPAILVV